MIKKLVLAITAFSLTVSMAGGVAFAADPPAAAPAATSSLFSSSKDAACGGAQANDNPVNCDASTAGTTINKLIEIGLNALSIVIGIAAVIMIIFGGFKFINSQGEGSNVASARNTIIYALVGLVVVALAQLIVRFVLTKTNPQPPKTPVPTTTMINEVKSLEVGRLYVV